MYIIKVFAVWVPEAILNLVIVLLIAGMKDKLKFNNKGNFIKFTSTVTCMILSSVFILPLIDKYFNNISLVISFIIHTIAYDLIFLAIYRVNIRTALISVLLMLFTLGTLENTYFPFLVAYVSGGYEHYVNSISQYVLFSCITRVAQIFIIIFLWNNEYVFLVTKLNKNLHRTFSIFVSGLAICELYISFCFSQFFSQMSVSNQILYGIVIIFMVFLFYLLVCKVIHSIIHLTLVQGYRQYQTLESGAEEAFKSVFLLLKRNDIESAKSYISLLIGSEENKS